MNGWPTRDCTPDEVTAILGRVMTEWRAMTPEERVARHHEIMRRIEADEKREWPDGE